MTEQLLHESATPLYAQLEEIFRTKVSTGEWAPGDRIPSENEFNRLLGVSRMTVRGVLTKLVEEGLLLRVAGKGTFVAMSKIQTKSPAYQGVREQLEDMGLQTSTQLIRNARRSPSASVRHNLRLGGNDDVFAIERVRSADGEPISLHYSYVPLRLAPTLHEHDPASEQLCVILDEHYGLSMKYVEEKLESVPANSEVAGRLGIHPGDPVLLLQDVIFDASRAPFEYSKILFRGDKVQIQFAYEL